MEEKKHIDRLYQEKFKEFEATPREAVWKNISSRLQEKKRKRSVLPVWYRIAGVAAVLALLFNYAGSLFKPSGNAITSKVTTEQERTFGELRLVSSSYTENMLRSSIILQALVQDTEKRKEAEVAIPGNRNFQESTSATVFTGILSTPMNISLPSTTKSFTEIAGTTPTEVSPSVQGISSAARTKDLQELSLSATNSPAEDEFNEISTPAKRMRVSTVAAPVYFENGGRGSAIDARFANNESSGEMSMAYGINFAYQISEKIKIRSGISKVDLSYNTRNIAFTASVNPGVLSGIDYNGDIPKYRIENTRARPFSNINASAEFNRASLAAPATGFLNQRLGFIEIPLEVEFAIIDKKVGLNLIGGGSTLFLDNNMISLNSANFSTNLGEANNLNNVSFSTNIGVGLDYNISPQFQLNLEPILKYQINTYSSSNLNPYFFGIYSGFSFNF